jgi:predicted 2-oxoglutarate/Fe(II)-dependent dioxygenase YbiX
VVKGSLAQGSLALSEGEGGPSQARCSEVLAGERTEKLDGRPVALVSYTLLFRSGPQEDGLSMPNATILGHLGLFVRRGFLSAEVCRQIRREMAGAPRVSAMVRPLGEPGGVLDETTRRTAVASVSASTTAIVEDQLRAIQPALEEYFQVRSAGWQLPQFYIYEEGDFFLAHRDSDAADPVAPDWVKARQLSVSILLNDKRGDLDGEPYGGGTLVFYGRRGDLSGAGFGIPLESEEGMFVAFRSDWIHEVKPVTRGRRYSVVTWYF